MDVDNGRIERVGFFFFRLSDGRFVKPPRFAVLGSKDNPPAVWTEGKIPFLPRCVGKAFSLALVNGGDVDITSNDEGKFFPVRAQGKLGNIIAVRSALSRSGTIVQTNLDGHLLRFRCSGWEDVNLAIISKTELAVVGHAEKPDRIPLEGGDLLSWPRLTVRQREVPDIKRPALFVQVVDVFFVRGPNGISIFALKTRELGMAASPPIIKP